MVCPTNLIVFKKLYILKIKLINFNLYDLKYVRS